MIIIPLFALLFILWVRLTKGMFKALLFILATKSIIDAFWNIKIGPLSILAVQGVMLPFLFYGVWAKKEYFTAFWKTSAKFYFLALSFGVFWVIVSSPINFLQNFFLYINCYMGFFLIPSLVKDKDSLQQVLLAIIIGGVFPMLVSLFQYQTGILFQERATVGLTRYVGFYHDAFPVRFYGLLTLFSILIYTNQFKLNRMAFKVFLFCITIGAIFSIYLVFSKAGIAILAVWGVLMIMFSKSKIKQIIIILTAFLFMSIIFGDVFIENIEQVFSKEVGYQEGKVKDSRYTLAGRGYIWQDYWSFWSEDQTLFFQWFGDGVNRPVHNEFFRMLLSSGIIGVVIFLTFLIRVILKVLNINKSVLLYALMLLAMYFIDCVGLTPGVYYYYNIILWGFIGLFIHKSTIFVKN